MDRGEFEAGPVQTQPSVMYKRKSNPVLLVAMVVFMLAAIGLGVWVAILLNNPKSESKVSKNETSQEQAVESGNGGISTPSGAPADVRIGYTIRGHCTIGFLTRGGVFYVEATEVCDSYYNGKSIGINSADAATGQNGTFTVTYGSGKDIAEYELMGVPADSDTVSINGFKVNDSGITAVAYAEIGQNWNGEKYVLVKEDGTIDLLLLDIQSNGKLQPKLMKNFGGFKNIASAIVTDNGNYVSTVLVTRNGGQISMTDALNGLYNN